MEGTLRPILLGLIAGVAAVVYLFPYFHLPGTWWRAIPSTGLILVLAVLVFRKQALAFLALRLTPRAWPLSLMVFVVAAFASNQAIGAIVAAEPLSAPSHRSREVLRLRLQELEQLLQRVLELGRKAYRRAVEGVAERYPGSFSFVKLSA